MNRAALILLCLSGCALVDAVGEIGGGEDDNSGRSGPADGDDSGPVILGWTAECVGEDTFEGTLTVDGTSDFAILNLWDTGDRQRMVWNEEHEIVGGRVVLQQTLHWNEVGGDQGGTIFGCGAGEQLDYAAGMLTYAVRAYDPDGNLSDCVQFGDEPESVSNGDYSVNAGAPTAAAELASCRTLN